MKLTKVLSPVTVALMLAGGLILTGCEKKDDQSQGSQTPSVKVDVFKVEPVTYTVKTTLPGRVIASQIAEIRPQVSGIILKREFEESSDVTAGQSLYQIDPAIYQASYESAQATLASAKADASLAQVTLKRYEGLLKTKSISQQDYDKAAAAAKQADAQVMVAQAAVNTAKVNLEYTRVNSPIDGYIGKSSVTEGALVSTAQATPLASVQQLDPIYIDMTQSVIKYEQDEENSKTLFNSADNTTSVSLTFNDGRVYPYQGYIKFSDRTVDETTGTVTIRAEFKNPDRQLLPGMFVKPQITLGTIDNAVLVPQKGITSDVQGNYTAKVVGANGMVESRNNVQVYGGIKNYWIVTGGINVGDQVIVSNLLNLSAMAPNAQVKAEVVSTTSITQQQVDDMINSNTK
ncbi:efflux RND transporter periplasmic adaptor subunit [Zophobihabitans entericus]|uniref:Efflux RND transporter periplasmic adaptor subunit n=1 Tax=Zophobihabitans entericus TaxID=1635327 RepID=A0A6G9IAF0_9GAMM|nr:efflux RND transporter periplasmic adaptor subunit [Zophobihabitans entericus]QIQ21193.1 efflux RND transporter periplasmic adaptor subunit [Zophobihabitans entericus]